MNRFDKLVAFGLLLALLHVAFALTRKERPVSVPNANTTGSWRIPDKVPEPPGIDI